MFNISIKNGSKKIIYKPLSISLKYLIDEKKLSESFKSLEKVFNIHVSELQRKSFLSEEGTEIRISKHDGKPDEVILSKVKLDDRFSVDYFRNHLAGLLPSLEKEEVKNLHIFIPKYQVFKNHFGEAEGFGSEEYFYQTFIEGIISGNYSFSYYKSEKKEKKDINIFFYADNEGKLISAIKTAELLMEGAFFTRDLQNEPASILTPVEMANRVYDTLSEEGVKVKIFDQKEIKKMKMGGLLAVGEGSSNDPRFVVIEYNGKSKKKNKKIALVGKGVTFDSGGISIKPSEKMDEMKADMSGAAVVAGTILAAAKAGLPVSIIGVIPLAENMLSGSSFRPGDIITTSSGKTIEVENTDAEGRLILADALHFASKQNPDLIIDLATLTGACVVALGEFVSGLFTKDESLSRQLYKSGIKTHERVWAMPMWDDYNTLIKSEIADIKNLGGRWGGAITAAKFLENFVDKKISWAHLDIAGPTGPLEINNYSKKYMNPFGVRLLFEYLKNI